MAQAKKKKSTSRKKKESRLHLRIDVRLADDIRAYAKRHGVGLTALVTKHFINLLAAERSASYPEAEQV